MQISYWKPKINNVLKFYIVMKFLLIKNDCAYFFFECGLFLLFDPEYRDSEAGQGGQCGQ